MRETRYRVCEDTTCNGHWRTQEVYQTEADEITELVGRVREIGPEAIKRLIASMDALAVILNPQYDLPLEEEPNDDSAERLLAA